MADSVDLKFRCPHCTRKLTIERRFSGREVACPDCGRELIVPSAMLAVGDLIADYQIELLLGTGSVGEVYLAMESKMGRHVALKILRQDSATKPDEVSDFLQEARILGNISHEHVVTAYKNGEWNGHHFLAMRYVDGLTLEQRIDIHGPISETRAVAIAATVADALDYAWARMHLLHRDLKPSNLMFDSDRRLQILDLGISQCMLKGQVAGRQDMILGSPAYMAPEQVRAGSSLDCRADIYGLGATLYHALTGHAPFEGDGRDIMRQKLTEPAPSALHYRRELSSGLVRLLSRCLSINPADRPQDWMDFLDDLSRVKPVGMETSG